jgi:hypothetical protein
MNKLGNCKNVQVNLLTSSRYIDNKTDNIAFVKITILEPKDNDILVISNYTIYDFPDVRKNYDILSQLYFTKDRFKKYERDVLLSCGDENYYDTMSQVIEYVNSYKNKLVLEYLHIHPIDENSSKKFFADVFDEKDFNENVFTNSSIWR